MHLCPHNPEQCREEDLPPCAQLILGERGNALREAAAALAPLAADIAARWRALCPATAAIPIDEQAVASTFGLLASGDSATLAVSLLSQARRLSEADVPLLDLIAASQAFGDACLAVLRARGAAAPVLLEARESLDRLGHVRVTLATCAYAHARGPTRGVAEAATAPPGRDRLGGLVGASAPMQRLYGQIEAAARTRATALIVGESGTGKELVARAIHRLSGDDADRFVAVNCAALPRELMESELFGHRKGAFSGAASSHAGLVRAAAGGTLFLDEIADLAPEAQAKLLRVIQERAVRGVGETHEAPVEVRILAATNQSPSALIASGRLRRDLYYRLERQVIEVPALRDHLEDLPLLVEHLAERWRETGDGLRRSLSSAAVERLALHGWPGNVRELENVVFAACAATAGPWVRLTDLPALGAATEPEKPPAAPELLSLRAAERAAIAEALRRTHGNKAQASRVLGISRKQLYVKLRVYGLES